MYAKGNTRSNTSPGDTANKAMIQQTSQRVQHQITDNWFSTAELKKQELKASPSAVVPSEGHPKLLQLCIQKPEDIQNDMSKTCI